MPLHIPSQFNIAEWFVDRPTAEHPRRWAILGEPDAITYEELGALVRRAAAALRGSGCTPGERVLIALPDSVEFMAAFFGAARIGAIAVPVNPWARNIEFAYYLEDSGARFAIVHASVLSEFPLTYCSREVEIVAVGQGESGGAAQRLKYWQEWLGPDQARNSPVHPTAATDPAFILYTSGSTGQPKGAVHQHKDMRVTSESMGRGVLGLTNLDRIFSVSKLFFAYGLGNAMYFPLSVGASVVLNPGRTKVDRVVELIARHRVTVFAAVPTFYAALLREIAPGLPADFSSLRVAVSAGEPLPAEIFEKFRARFGVEILDGIGSTEMLQTFISNRPGQARAGTCGVPVPNYEIEIAREDGTPAATGEVGDMRVRGPSAFAGYWNKPELSARARIGGWVVTGDRFSRDAEGYYHFCGRQDDLMKISGMWVSPGEVEIVLLEHPRVAEAAVAGVPDSSGLLQPTAFIVCRPGTIAGGEIAAEILEYARGRLPSHKRPRSIEFVSELPKTATGKIQRFRLRTQAQAHAAGGSTQEK